MAGLMGLYNASQKNLQLIQEMQQRLAERQKAQQQQPSGPSVNYGKLMTPRNQLPTAEKPTGSTLVTGGPGSGAIANYGGSMGLSGAVAEGGLGGYGSAGLLAAPEAAGTYGLGAASQGLTYGAGTGAAAGGFGLEGAASGLSYGGGAAAGSGGLMAAAPYVAAGAAGLGIGDYLDKSGISSWGQTLKGQAPGRVLDSIGATDGAAGNILKSAIAPATGDFQGLFGGAKNAVKDLFSFKWF